MRRENFQHESETKLTESDVIFLGFSAEDVLSFKFSVCIIERVKTKLLSGNNKKKMKK